MSRRFYKLSELLDKTLGNPHRKVPTSVPVTKHTRAPRAGRDIYCPLCGSRTTVYHFAWSALVCPTCKIDAPKLLWETDA